MIFVVSDIINLSKIKNFEKIDAKPTKSTRHIFDEKLVILSQVLIVIIFAINHSRFFTVFIAFVIYLILFINLRSKIT